MLWRVSFCAQKLFDDRYEKGQSLAATSHGLDNDVLVPHE